MEFLSTSFSIHYLFVLGPNWCLCFGEDPQTPILGVLGATITFLGYQKTKKTLKKWPNFSQNACFEDILRSITSKALWSNPSPLKSSFWDSLQYKVKIVYFLQFSWTI